jgi:hypothetical protein
MKKWGYGVSDWNVPQPGPRDGDYPQFGPPTTSSGKAVAVMVLGIVSLVLMCAYGFGVIPAIVALALSPSANREIANSGGRIVGAGFVKAGVACSWVTVGFTALALVTVVIVVILSAAQGS